MRLITDGPWFVSFDCSLPTHTKFSFLDVLDRQTNVKSRSEHHRCCQINPIIQLNCDAFSAISSPLSIKSLPQVSSFVDFPTNCAFFPRHRVSYLGFHAITYLAQKQTGPSNLLLLWYLLKPSKLESCFYSLSIHFQYVFIPANICSIFIALQSVLLVNQEAFLLSLLSSYRGLHSETSLHQCSSSFSTKAPKTPQNCSNPTINDPKPSPEGTQINPFKMKMGLFRAVF